MIATRIDALAGKRRGSTEGGEETEAGSAGGVGERGIEGRKPGLRMAAGPGPDTTTVGEVRGGKAMREDALASRKEFLGEGSGVFGAGDSVEGTAGRGGRPTRIEAEGGGPLRTEVLPRDSSLSTATLGGGPGGVLP